MPPNKSKRGKNSNRGSSSKAKPQTPPTPVSESVPQPPKVRRAFLELLEMVDDGKIASVDLDNGKFSEGTKTPESEKFFKFYQQLATDDENLLHYTIKESVGSEGELERRMGLIKWLLKDYPAIFGQENAQGRTALEIAIARYNSKFKISRQKDPGPKRYEVYRKFVLYCLADPSLKKQCVSILDNSTVSESSSNTHIAIKEMGVDIIPYLDLFDRATLERKDHAGNTPLHLAVDVQFWREDEKSEEKSEDEKSEDEISEDEISEEDISDDERSDDEKSDDEKSEKRVELVRKLIDLGREALMITNGPDDPDYNETKRMSPYRYHQSSCLEHHKDPKGIGSCENKSCKGVEFILKDAYMHFQDGTEAIKLLYNGHPMSYSHLDLSEYTEVKPSPPDFLNNIAQSLEKMNLDTILHYVYLPKDPMLSEQSLDNPDEYVNYSVVFESLRKKVKKIIKLKVEDNEDLPHSDEEIVNALQGIDVEIWDWVQYDLCCDTIAKAARNVKEVFLYSTGNKAVLQSWSSNEGLNKLKHLEIIHIKIKSRPSSGKSTLDYEKFLCSRLKKNGVAAKIVIEVEDPLSKRNGAMYSATPPSSEFGSTNQIGSWFACMDKFSQFINNIPEEAGNPVVKIAILDDGVNAHMGRFLYTDIGGAISFHTRGGLEHDSEKVFTHHFPSTTGHGAEMAERVLQVFPKAKLYVARLNVCEEDGNTAITAYSAAEAIKWAVREKVDIISMSWTIEKTKNNGEDLDAMEDAIDQAHKQNILMFCAAKDCGYVQGDNFGYPKNFDQPVFCIGATTENGTLSESIGSQKSAIDFGFPGENLEPLSENSGVEKITGSSIATALASGFAGLLLYCIQFDKESQPEQAKKDLQSHEVMKRTLKKMVDNSQHYIPVPIYFELGSVSEWNREGRAAFYNIVNTIRMYMK